MAISKTGTSTSNSLGGEYQVFLSFRGPDTRHGFADTLYHALSEAGIHVFIDYEEIRPGERIDGELLRAIDDSRLYIPIFSPNYASSYWCLCELAKMVENISNSKKDGNEKVILPIFYKVEPDVVKLRTPSFEKDIQNLEQMMKDKKKNFNSEDVDAWRRALKTVGGISGLDLKNYTGDGHLSKSVVDKVVKRLQTRHRKVTQHLVGVEERIAIIKNLLDIDSGGVRLIGIYGMGGIGKTTLVKIIYNQLCPYFGKNCSFLDNVRETAKIKGLVELQKQLLFDFSNSGVDSDIRNIDHGINRIGDTICSKKVLIVLDDVDEGDQIQNLVGVNSLCHGTIIFVTTRYKSVLKIRDFKYEIKPYEMEGLSHKDALQLFSRHAFNDKSPPPDYYTLSEELVLTAGGLPLANQVIGASLFEQEDKHIWEEMLEELRNKPHDDVLGKLKITYDALKPAQQNIFLDIACFFINEENINPVFVWADCMFGPKSAIDVLIKRCMIKVLDNNKFWMHDQFRDLGRAIAKEEGTRLWDTADIIRKLSSTEEKRSVQALCFRPRWGDPRITVNAKEIKRFPHLQFLWLNDVTLQGDLASCLSKLKWIYLSGILGFNDVQPSMPTNLHLENVVVLHTRFHEWTEDAVKSQIKEAMKLKALIIESCRLTHGTPTFSEHLVLEKLSFLECSSLKKISCSIGKLRWLTCLDFEDCVALEKLPKQISELKNLQHLSLRTCESLRELPDSISKLESLTKLDIDDCDKIQGLPELPRSLTTLRLISKSLQNVPNVSNLTNLVELLLLSVSYWSDIIQPCDLPCIGRLSKLKKLDLCLLNVRATSIEWDSLSLLEELYLDGLDLQTLKQLPSNLRVLWLTRIQVKQVELDVLPNLEELTFQTCKPVARISFTSSLNKLRNVRVQNCQKLVEVQFRGVLKSMESLRIGSCKSLERLICLSEEELGCNELQAPELTDVQRRVSLVSSSLKMPRKLEMLGCLELQQIQFVSTLEALKKFSVIGCISLKRLGGLLNMKNLNSLEIGLCKNLQVVEGTDKLEGSEKLVIVQCISMERIIYASILKIPKKCRITILHYGQLPVSSITCECYRKMIVNAQTQVSDSAVETTFPEIGDPLLEQQDDGDDNDEEEDYCWEDDDDEYDEDDEDNEHEDHENNDGEDDEVDNVHSSHGSSPVCSEDYNDENDDVDEEGDGEANSYSYGKDDEDKDDDDDGEDDEDNNLHEVLRSSHGTPPVYSMGNDDEKNDVNEEGDRDEDRTRTRKRKRGTMKKPKRSKMTVMATTMMNTTTEATTTERTMTVTRTTVCSSIWSCLAGFCKFFPWTTTMRRRMAKGEGQCDGDDGINDEEAEE